MSTHRPIEARIKGPTGRWYKCNEVEHLGDGLVRVIYQGRFHTVHEDSVRERRGNNGRAAYSCDG
jgi:hypothetical protein